MSVPMLKWEQIISGGVRRHFFLKSVSNCFYIIKNMMEKRYNPDNSSNALNSFYPFGFYRLVRELQAGRGEFDNVHTICLAWAKSVLNIKNEERPGLFDPTTEPSSESS